MININHQGCLMKIIQYNNANDIMIEFQDKYNKTVHTSYKNFIKGNVKNSFYPMVLGVGILGNKYPSKNNGKHLKEYKTWNSMLRRCFDEKYKTNEPSYENVICCKDWLNYENFYEWIHSQTNFDKWQNNSWWQIDKDILVKGNKIYSPDTCCLVPINVNELFTNRANHRGDFPIGVSINKKTNKYIAECHNPFTNKKERIGTYSTAEKAFQAYKQYKEDIIKQVAQKEYDKGNITKRCYDAMMKYKVEITD